MKNRKIEVTIREKCRIFYGFGPISLPKMFIAGQGGPPGGATGPLLEDDGSSVAMQQRPRCNPGRPLRQKESGQKTAHLRKFCRNGLVLSKKKMHVQISRIYTLGKIISEYCKDLKSFV